MRVTLIFRPLPFIFKRPSRMLYNCRSMLFTSIVWLSAAIGPQALHLASRPENKSTHDCARDPGGNEIPGIYATTISNGGRLLELPTGSYISTRLLTRYMIHGIIIKIFVGLEPLQHASHHLAFFYLPLDLVHATLHVT